MKVKDFFDKIYCINLDERVDRWERAQKEFEKIGLKNVERFSAIKDSDGRRGCLNSHLSIIQNAKENNLKNVLIFEDDVFFIDENIHHIENCLDQLENQNWTLFYFGATLEPNYGALTKVSENLVKTNFAFTTHAYAINSSIFEKVLNEAPKAKIIDVYYCHRIVPLGSTLIINPIVAIQQEGFSDIENHNADYGWMIDFYNRAKRRGGVE